MIRPKQRAVLELVVAEYAAGWPLPSLREIAAHFGWRASRAARHHVDRLVEAGILRAREGRERRLAYGLELSHPEVRALLERAWGAA